MSSNQEDYKKHILDIIDRFRNGEASKAEIREMDEWYENAATAEKYADGMSAPEKLQAREKMLHRINSRIYQEAVPVKKITIYQNLKRIAIAAAVLLFCGTGLFYALRPAKQVASGESIAQHDFKPGGNKAILTLAGGRQIILNGAKNGQLALQGSVAVNKTADGQVVYHAGETSNAAMTYNNLSTPAGGQYHLTLADGTGVWLNAASSIKYPTVFNGKERKVEITGEAYFEVAHNPAKPFKVISNGQTVEVLGTHFNVNSYANEASVKTTLLQGSVRVSASGNIKVLKPGQQSSADQSGIKVGNVDVDGMIAWKDGYFDFTDSDIQTIMRQFSRWYNVDITFEGPVTTETFTGRIPRSWNLSQVMKIVQSSKSVHLSVAGRRIMVKQ